MCRDPSSRGFLLRLKAGTLALGGFSPNQRRLQAVDHVYTSGDSVDFLFYLGKRFTVSEASQGGRRLSVEAVENLRSATRHLLRGDALGPEVTIKWEGAIEQFDASRVCVMSGMVERW